MAKGYDMKDYDYFCSACGELITIEEDQTLDDCPYCGVGVNTDYAFFELEYLMIQGVFDGGDLLASREHCEDRDVDLINYDGVTGIMLFQGKPDEILFIKKQFEGFGDAVVITDDGEAMKYGFEIKQQLKKNLVK